MYADKPQFKLTEMQNNRLVGHQQLRMRNDKYRYILMCRFKRTL